MNGGRAFFDTNVLLYIYGSDAVKRVRAKQLFQNYVRNRDILLSTQVVQEFYAVGSRKLGMPRDELQEATAGLLELPLVIVGPWHIASAIQNEQRYKISFWDGLIIAAAESGRARRNALTTCRYRSDVPAACLHTSNGRNP